MAGAGRAAATPPTLTETVSAMVPISGRSTDGDVIHKATVELNELSSRPRWGMSGKANIGLNQDYDEGILILPLGVQAMT